MKRKTKIIAVSCLAAALLIEGALVTAFFIGWTVPPESLAVIRCDVNGGEADLRLTLTSGSMAIHRGNAVISDGVIRIKLKQVLVSRFFRDGSYEQDYQSVEEIQAIYLTDGNEDRQIWPKV